AALRGALRADSRGACWIAGARSWPSLLSARVQDSILVATHALLSNGSASTTNQPDDYEPGCDCRRPSGTQRALGHMRRRCEELESQLRSGCPQQALDHHHEPD